MIASNCVCIYMSVWIGVKLSFGMFRVDICYRYAITLLKRRSVRLTPFTGHRSDTCNKPLSNSTEITRTNSCHLGRILVNVLKKNVGQKNVSKIQNAFQKREFSLQIVRKFKISKVFPKCNWFYSNFDKNKRKGR